MNSAETLKAIKDNIKKVIVGKDDVIDMLLVAMICSGHVLVEDVPGLGKTTMVSALASSIGCDFQRIQFTPDVLPSDITGFTMFNMKTGEKEFHKGSIMHQIVLADEINRASPKSQSAMLEAMQEHQVTVDGKTFALPELFMVLATQNSVEMAGTYPLPEAQLDRFFMQIKIGYPTKQGEVEILKSHRSVNTKVSLEPVADAADILNIQNSVENVHCDEELIGYIVDIAEATRKHPGVLVGVSPRGEIALLQAACGNAILNGRDFVTPDDIKRMAPFTLGHRVIMRSSSEFGAENGADVVNGIIGTIKVPKAQ